MKILIDECIPRRFKSNLPGHTCQTVPEAGLAGKKNGELLKLAEVDFEALITLDKGLEYQQNLAERKIAILVIHAKSSRLTDVQPHAPACLEAPRSIQSGQLVHVGDFRDVAGIS